ncbi:MAG: GGDEF domain-containing protein [Acidobacteriota bacterium]|nr:GGDEF domain-containing protein [Acidobacteriota bacterium]
MTAAWLQAVLDALCDVSSKDALTGLVNRRSFEMALGREIDRVARAGESALLLMLDIDHFKAVNDTYGHAAGDAVLKQIAAILTETARKPDMVVRWGGEEFVVVARDTDRNPPSRLAERIRQRVEQHVFSLPSGQTIPITCSIGYSVFPFHERSPAILTWEQIISVADSGMYFAKTHGRNRSVGLVAGDGVQESSDILSSLEHSLEQTQADGLVRLVE